MRPRGPPVAFGASGPWYRARGPRGLDPLLTPPTPPISPSSAWWGEGVAGARQGRVPADKVPGVIRRVRPPLTAWEPSGGVGGYRLRSGLCLPLPRAVWTVARAPFEGRDGSRLTWRAGSGCSGAGSRVHPVFAGECSDIDLVRVVATGKGGTEAGADGAVEEHAPAHEGARVREDVACGDRHDAGLRSGAKKSPDQKEGIGPGTQSSTEAHRTSAPLPPIGARVKSIDGRVVIKVDWPMP